MISGYRSTHCSDTDVLVLVLVSGILALRIVSRNFWNAAMLSSCNNSALPFFVWTFMKESGPFKSLLEK